MHEDKRFIIKRNEFFIRVAALIIPLICVLLLLSQTVFAQNTYVITDGSRVLVYTTYATDPVAVLGEAGLELDEDDTYTTQKSNGVSEITVCRAQEGSPDSAVVHAQETYTDSISHRVTYCEDPSMPKGMQRILTEGEDGQMVCTASVVYKNGEEISRTITKQTMVQTPVDEVIAVGTGSETASTVSGVPVIGDGLILTPSGDTLTYTDVLHVTATAYTCEGYVGTTATGTVARVGAIAVDPSVIPYGTRMYIVSDDGTYIYGVATAEDCGGLIIGNRIDLYYNTEWECWQFGCRACTIYVLG